MGRSRNRILAVSLTIALGVAFSACGDEQESSGSSSATGPSSSATQGSGGAQSSSTTAAGGDSSVQAQSSSQTTVGSGGSGGSPVTNNGFPEQWIDATNCGSEPDIQVWQYGDDTFILRQSICTHFEGPFIYLLFGEDKVFVQDTGTGDVNLQAAIQGVVDQWLVDNGQSSIEIVVTHSHGHGDHVGGDNQFQNQPNTQLVGTSQGAVVNFFGISDWPNQIVEYDLGGRVLTIIPLPGHQGAHIAVYDPRQELLLTGDTLYPGRLYINDWNDYRASIQRLVDFVNDGHPVTWVLGTHIELRADGTDYSFGASSHPNEHHLQLTTATLLELNAACQAMGNSPSYEEHDDFIIYP